MNGDFRGTDRQQKFSSTPNDNNKVGTFESVLAGIGSGLIGIPKGLFSLGATLMDLRASTPAKPLKLNDGLMISQNGMRKQKRQPLANLQKF